MAEKVIIVTGFEPWGSWTRNPSGEIATELRGESVGGYRLETGVLPVSWDEDVTAAVTLVEHHHPAAVVSLGLGGGTALRMEKVAVNLRGGDDGERLIKEGGPDAWFSSLPVHAMAERSREAGVPAVVSYHAGTFMCNHIMYQLRDYFETWELVIPSGFIHMPPMPEQLVDLPSPGASMPKDLIRKGVVAAIGAVVDSIGNLKA